MITVSINRFSCEPKQTLGKMEVLSNGKFVYECKTLELPWLENTVRKSCIPVGTYSVVKRNSRKYGAHFHIQNVPDRSYILIHHGNYHWDILGCILVGRDHLDINGDGFRDVTSSKVTMRKLNEILPDTFQLVIV